MNPKPLSEEKKQEIIEKFNELCQGKITALSILTVNYTQGHPYTIGPRHIQNSILNDDEIRRLEKTGVHCVHPGCTASYDDHGYEHGIFIQLQCNLTNKEAADLLYPVRIQLLEPNEIAGLALVEHPEKFRILKEETDANDNKEQQSSG